VQKGVACECWQNEYLFENAATCTYFGAICYKIECVLMQNGLRFGAKRKVKCRKMQCVLLLNARQNAAKCETKSINIHSNCINNTFANLKTHG